MLNQAARKPLSLFIASIFLVLLQSRSAEAAKDSMCPTIRTFVNSIGPGEEREFVFRTNWGSNFNDDKKFAVQAVRCEHNKYVPAQALCDYLIKYGSIETPARNVKRAIICLSPMTHFDNALSFTEASFTFNYGTDERGSILNLELIEDAVIGGFAFRIAVSGY